MKLRILSAFYVVILVYFVLSVIIGPAGLSASHELERQSYVMQGNLDSLARKTEELEIRLESMRSDPETMKIEARALGYIDQEEGIIALPVSLSVPVNLDTGLFFTIVEPKIWTDPLIKTISLGIGLLSFFLLLLIPAKSRKSS